MAPQAIDRPRNLSGGDKLDVWVCLSAALLDPAVLVAMDERMASADVELLRRLATLLAEPAATVCRQASDDPLAA